MRVVAVVQARTRSTRLPGKVLAPLGDRPLIVQLLRRLSAAGSLDAIVLATGEDVSDDPLEETVRDAGFPVFRGSEQDVLRRFRLAAAEYAADVVVRVTGDCPLVDPAIVDRVVGELLEHRNECDYASNVVERAYPKGLDVEALFADALARVDRMAVSPQAREHVTCFAYAEAPHLFGLHSVRGPSPELADMNWSVDTASDLEHVRALHAAARLDDRIAGWEEILPYAAGAPQP